MQITMTKTHLRDNHGVLALLGVGELSDPHEHLAATVHEERVVAVQRRTRQVAGLHVRHGPP
jgi:hypothetical protein